MGDKAELRGILFVIGFLSCFFIVASYIPPQLQSSNFNSQWREVNVPEEFEASNILIMNYSAIDYVNSSEYSPIGYMYMVDKNIGGWDIRLVWEINPDLNLYWMKILHVEKWWIFETGKHPMKWYNSSGFPLPEYDPTGQDPKSVNVADLNSYFDENGYAKFRVRCEHFSMDIAIHYDPSKYASFFNAFKSNDFIVMFGLTIDNLNTKFSAWDLIGRLLFFQMPNVHPVINMLIAIPIWTCIAYLVYVLILKAIPFVGG